MIVFPEYGITGESNYGRHHNPNPLTPKTRHPTLRNAWVSGGYTEEFGSPSGTVPCDEPSRWHLAASLVSLSCAAKSSGVAVVANLAENDPTAAAMYNVDVAFDTDGTFLAKYRKQNLWVRGAPALTPTD